MRIFQKFIILNHNEKPKKNILIMTKHYSLYYKKKLIQISVFTSIKVRPI